MELRQLIQLKKKGLSNRKVAEQLHISRNTVNAYVKTFSDHGFSYSELLELSDKDICELFPTTDYKDADRYGILSGYFEYFSKEMSKPGCTLQQLWREYLARHPGGYRYTQFVTHYNSWKGKLKASGILQHKAAEKLFIDFAGKKLHYVDRETGEVHPVEVFVAVLPCSQYTYVQAVESQKRHDLIDCLNSCLRWIGGVPRAIVCDNLKSAVKKAHKYAPVINRTIQAFALHYNCVIDPTRPYHPRDKAMVEGAVKLVYQRIFYPLSKHTFFSLKELNEAITQQLIEYNNYTFQNVNTTRSERFAEIERSELHALPSERYQVREYKRAKVSKNCFVRLGEDKSYYSVPYRYIGQNVEVQYNRTTVEIFYNHERIASHRRIIQQGRYNAIAEHMPSAQRAYSEWNPDYFAKRSRKVGPRTARYIDRLIEQYDYPEIAYKQAQGILALGRYYSNDRLENACRRALDHHRASYHTIENILKNNLDSTQAEDLFGGVRSSVAPHDNIRGADHYQ